MDVVWKWYPATIVAVDATRGVIKIQYVGWSEVWNEWISEACDERLAWSCVKEERPLPVDSAVGDYLDARDYWGNWVVATVIDSQPGSLKIHFQGWAERYDDCIDQSTYHRLAPLHSHTRPWTRLSMPQLCNCKQNSLRNY